MRILVDTNVILDVIQKREPFLNASMTVLAACREGIIDGSVSAQSIADMFYILRKAFSAEERRKILFILCQIVDVEPVDKQRLTVALENSTFADFEDCLQAVCATTYKADYIITRNIKHFTKSPIPDITPDDFVSRYLTTETDILR